VDQKIHGVSKNNLEAYFQGIRGHDKQQKEGNVKGREIHADSLLLTGGRNIPE
jgi:hypothetical protein